MKLLLDIHLLLWAAGSPDQLLVVARPLLEDPFNRILVAQATVEGITLLTADALVAKYLGPVRQV